MSRLVLRTIVLWDRPIQVVVPPVKVHGDKGKVVRVIANVQNKPAICFNFGHGLRKLSLMEPHFRVNMNVLVEVATDFKLLKHCRGLQGNKIILGNCRYFRYSFTVRPVIPDPTEYFVLCCAACIRQNFANAQHKNF